MADHSHHLMGQAGLGSGPDDVDLLVDLEDQPFRIELLDPPERFPEGRTQARDRSRVMMQTRQVDEAMMPPRMGGEYWSLV